jgi:hypothetical protein
MRRADRIAGLGLFVFGIWFSAVGLQYPYWGAGGPGSGFLPFWLGLAMATLALLLLIGAMRSREPGASWHPQGEGLKRLAAVLGVTAAFIAGLKVVGMILGTALFLVTTLRFIERYRWSSALAIAAATAVVNYLVFTYWLRVPMPVSPLGF